MTCPHPFINCPVFKETGWSCVGTNYSYPFGLSGGHYSLYLDDERYYDEWDRQIEKETREIKESEDFDAHVIPQKQHHVPDPNIPRIGECGPLKKLLTKIKKANRKEVMSKKKENRKEVDTYEGDDWLLEYIEELEYWEYNNDTTEIAA